MIRWRWKKGMEIMCERYQLWLSVDCHRQLCNLAGWDSFRVDDGLPASWHMFGFGK